MGNGQTTESNSPIILSQFSNVITLTSGEYHVLVVAGLNLQAFRKFLFFEIHLYLSSLNKKENGNVYGWADGNDGELGNNITSDQYSPVIAIGLSYPTSLSAGAYHSFALIGKFLPIFK